MKTRCLAVLSGAVLIFSPALPAQEETEPTKPTPELSAAELRELLQKAASPQAEDDASREQRELAEEKLREILRKGATLPAEEGKVRPRRVILPPAGPKGQAEPKEGQRRRVVLGKPPEKAEAGGERIEIFMPNADLREEIVPMYADISGKKVVVHGSLPRMTLTAVAQWHMPAAEAVVFCETAMLASGIAVVETTPGTVTLLSFKELGENAEFVPPVVATRAKLPEGERIVEFTLPARGLDAEKLRIFLTERVKARPFTRLDAAPDGKSVLVRETGSTIRRMLELIDVLAPEDQGGTGRAGPGAAEEKPALNELVEFDFPEADLAIDVVPFYEDISGIKVVVHGSLQRGTEMTAKTAKPMPATEAVLVLETSMLEAEVGIVEARPGTLVLLPFWTMKENPDIAPPVVTARADLPEGERIVDFVLPAQGPDTGRLRALLAEQGPARPFTRIDAAPDGKSVLVRETGAMIRLLLDAPGTEKEAGNR